MIILREKSYSIFQELYHSGAKRVKKKYLGRLRRGISEKAREVARGQIAKNKKLNRAIDRGEVSEISNPELARKLVKAGREKGDVRVFDENLHADVTGQRPGNYNVSINPGNKSGYKEDYETGNYSRRVRKVLKAMIDRKNIVNLKGNYKDNVATLAHEIGHAMNDTGSGGRTKKVISRLKGINFYKDSPKDMKERLKRNLVTLKEESNAWDNAEGLLKDLGASKEELKTLKEQKDACLGTYKSNALAGLGNDVFEKYSPAGVNKYLGINQRSVSADRRRIVENLMDKFGGSIPQDEILEMAGGMKTDKQLYRLQQKRKARRKDKSTLRQIFGNW